MAHIISEQQLREEFAQLHRKLITFKEELMTAIQQSEARTTAKKEVAQEQMLNSREVEGMLHISHFKLNAMRVNKEIPFVRIGHAIRYPLSGVRQMLHHNNAL